MATLDYKPRAEPAPQTKWRGNFQPRDLEFLNNPKGLAKTRTGLERLPYDFHFIVDDSGGTKIGQDPVVDGKPGVITIIYSNNVTGLKAWMPMNLWTMCHRIGHIWQTNQTRFEINGCDIGFRNIARIWNATWPMHRIEAEPPAALNTVRIGEGSAGLRDPQFMFRMFGCSVMTMKSARQFNIINDLDIVGELIAQYLVTGRVRIKAPTRLSLEAFHSAFQEHATYGMAANIKIIDTPQLLEKAEFLSDVDPLIAEIERDIEREIKIVLDGMVGKSFAF